MRKCPCFFIQGNGLKSKMHIWYKEFYDKNTKLIFSVRIILRNLEIEIRRIVIENQ